VRFSAGCVAIFATASGCFSYTPPNGWLRCASESPECPTDYYCGDDRRCYREGFVREPHCALDPGSPSLCDSGFLLCDDFEAPTLREPWITFHHNNPALIEVDSQRAYRGQRSLHVQATVVSNGFSSAMIYETAIVPSPDLYVRAFVYISSAPSDPELLMKVENSAFLGQEVWLLPTEQLRIENQISQPVAVAESANPLPLNCWVCLEWEVYSDAAAGKMGLWLDDTVQTPLLTGNTLRTGDPQDIFLGVFFRPGAKAGGTYDAWYDEIVIDSKPIHCDR